MLMPSIYEKSTPIYSVACVSYKDRYNFQYILEMDNLPPLPPPLEWQNTLYGKELIMTHERLLPDDNLLSFQLRGAFASLLYEMKRCYSACY